MADRKTMRTWAEVDLDALAHNYHTLRALAREDCKFLGVVKANAYGHGAPQIAAKLEALGADMLAVACVTEAAQLREAGITLPLLCLGNTLPEYAPLLLEYHVTQTVGDLETGRALSVLAQAAGTTLDIHIKLDTGMSRLGFFWSREGQNDQVLEELIALCQLPNLNIQGMFTHFSDADGSEAYTMEQLTRFLEAKDALAQRGISPTLLHCGASAAALKFPCTHMNMIRPGISLYGYYPASDMDFLTETPLRPVMTLKSRVVAVRRLPAGTSISYGRTAQLPRDSTLAVLPIGYGDGLPRGLSNRAQVRIHGTLCPIVGRICMDMCMIDVTDLPQVQPGDVALLYDGPLTERAAELQNTIVYELLCQLTPRIPRLYLGETGPSHP